MRLCVASALLIAAALPISAQSALAMGAPGVFAKPHSDMIVSVRGRRYERPARDCTPTNGPFGFYGNIWCQPANDRSYLRNLGASWPMNTPPSLRQAKPHDTGSDW